MTKLTPAGAVSWATTFGGTSADICYAIAVDNANAIHLAGLYRLTVDFDPDPNTTNDLTNTKGSDMFLLKLTQS